MSSSSTTQQTQAKDQPQPSSLDRLKIWIDSPRPLEQNNTKESLYLHNPAFTDNDLKEALIYGLRRVRSAVALCVSLDAIAGRQYQEAITKKGFAEEVDEGEHGKPENLLDVDTETPAFRIRRMNVGGQNAEGEEIDPVDGENKMGMDIDPEKKSRFRRTVVAVARMLKKVEKHNLEMRAAIGEAQAEREEKGGF